MESVKGKTIVITGGGGVLCGALAVGLAEHGARVVVLGRRREPLTKVVDRIREKGFESLAVQADVLDESSLRQALAEILKTFGPCDILINGAGGNHPSGTTSKPTFSESDLDVDGLKTFFDLDPKGIQDVFNLNFTGTFLPTQVFARDMIGREGCSILNISSVSAVKPLTKVPAYSGAKAALTNFTQWMAVHFAKVNIRVNAISPGFFLTDQNRTLLTTGSGDLTERGQSIIAHTPMGRFGDPQDLIGAVLFLSGSSAGFVTGIVLSVDGGFSAFGGV